MDRLIYILRIMATSAILRTNFLSVTAGNVPSNSVERAREWGYEGNDELGAGKYIGEFLKEVEQAHLSEATLKELTSRDVYTICSNKDVQKLRRYVLKLLTRGVKR